jgi:hypothetical protein
MSSRRRSLAVTAGTGRARTVAAALIAAALASIVASPAAANTGYELSTAKSTIPLGAEVPHGVAVDQASHEIYVGVVNRTKTEFGDIRRFKPDGTANGIIGGGANAAFTGVAVNPLTQGIFGAEIAVHAPFGTVGTPRIHLFSSSGVAGGTFATSDTEAVPQIATDSGGLVYFPNAQTNSVQVFNAAGALQETIVCTGCPGGAFGQPNSVAIDSEDNLYVVDLLPDRVVKFTDSGGGYAYASILQSGLGATGVGVDPSTDDVLVSDLPSGGSHHIVAYDSSGVKFDDFGAGVVTLAFPELGALAGPQLAADALSHKLYVGSKDQLFVFDRVTISPPVVTTEPAAGVGQLVATLPATINAKGHATLACDFEYVDDTEFLAEGFANPTEVPCSSKPASTANTSVTAGLTGLTPATQYHFRAVATSHAGTTTGGTQTFTTLPALPPTVTTEPATNVAETTATLVGKVNPRGGTVSDCHFEYGTTGSYGTNVPCGTKPGPVNSQVTRTVALKGLASGTEYHYRFVVTTNAGTEAGADVTFTTVSPPPDPEPEPVPPPTPAPTPTPTAEPPPPIVAPAISCKPGYVKVKSGGKVVCMKRCRKGFVRKKVGGKLKCVRKQARRRAGQS